MVPLGDMVVLFLHHCLNAAKNFLIQECSVPLKLQLSAVAMPMRERVGWGVVGYWMTPFPEERVPLRPLWIEIYFKQCKKFHQ